MTPTHRICTNQTALEADEPTVLFCLQHWIEPRTIGGEGYWYWDLTSIFRSQHEAETDQAEFHWDDERTRIVKLEAREVEVVAVFDAAPVVASGRLFA